VFTLSASMNMRFPSIRQLSGERSCGYNLYYIWYVSSCFLLLGLKLPTKLKRHMRSFWLLLGSYAISCFSSYLTDKFFIGPA
jgi:hypothetical protein